MPQQHLDRLTSTDASFLHQEGPASHMHIGAVLVFEGPPPAFDDYLDHVRGRLHQVPRYRQKLATPPLETGRPLWVDDPSFNLEYHVRHTALPTPGTEEQLWMLTARIHSQQLDRARPLWESWLVEGLEGDRFALIFKTHHSLVDGVSGVDLATVLFDLERSPASDAADPSTSLEPWAPRPEPSAAELVLAGVRGMVGTTTELATRAVSAALRPEASLRKLRDMAEGLGELMWAIMTPAPETPLNVEIGPHRRYAVVSQRLEDYKEVKNAFGGTVNDVVLTVVSGALARWLRSRGIRTEGLEMRALVPVSVRTADDEGSLGNRLTVMRGPLPVYIRDAVARLRVVRQAMDGLKESKQAVGASTLAAVNDLAPPTILAQASRLNFSTRLFNLIVTNIPGPQLPLYVLGRELVDLFPVAFLPSHHGLAVAIMSYNGALGYGLLADYDALPDLDVIAEGIEASLAELLAAARARSGGGASEGGAAADAGDPGADAGDPGAAAGDAGADASDPGADAGDAGERAGGARVGAAAAAAAATAGAGTGNGSAGGSTSRRRTPATNGGPAPIVPGAGQRRKDGPATDMRRRGRRSRGKSGQEEREE